MCEVKLFSSRLFRGSITNDQQNTLVTVNWGRRIHPYITGNPTDTRRWINVGLTLVQRRRRWTNNKPTLIQRLVSAGQVVHPRFLHIFCMLVTSRNVGNVTREDTNKGVKWYSQLVWDVDPVLDQCWDSIQDATQHWDNKTNIHEKWKKNRD